MIVTQTQVKVSQAVERIRKHRLTLLFLLSLKASTKERRAFKNAHLSEIIDKYKL